MTKQETLQFLDTRLTEFLSKSEEEQKELVLKAKRKVFAMTKEKHDRAIRIGLEDLVKMELAGANERHPLFASNHEAYAVILEEVEELLQETAYASKYSNDFWNEIKGIGIYKCSTCDVLKDLKRAALQSAQEAIQIAAMCDKAIMSEDV